MSPVSVSIILCSRNRSRALQQSIASLGKLKIHSDWKAELIVVDNASTDDTARVVKSADLGNMEKRYIHETRNGKGYALNTGLAEARGDFILFTDDDVVVAEDWAEKMVSALSKDGCQVVTGRISLAPTLSRPWLSTRHKWWLASSEDALLREGSRELIGANVGFRRSVLEQVPWFDPELGPGALGLGEDTLFGWQLVEAGFKIGYAQDASLIHCPDASRLQRKNWLALAQKQGRTQAYQLYHWHHDDLKSPRLKWLWLWSKLHARRIFETLPALDMEGCPRWEMSYVLDMEKCKQYLVERRRPRNYARRGLRKLNAESPVTGHS